MTHSAPQKQFNDDERRLLLAERGIGPKVIERLEEVSATSMAQLCQIGAPRAVLDTCASVGSIAWTNRRRSLERALLRSLRGEEFTT